MCVDEELADVQMEALAEEMRPEEVMVAEAEAIVDVMEALAEEMMPQEVMVEEMMAGESAAADDGELHGWEHLSRGDLVHDLAHLTEQCLFNHEMFITENVDDLCGYALAMVSKLFLNDDEYKKFAVKHNGIEVDVRALLEQLLRENYDLFEEKAGRLAESEGKSDGESDGKSDGKSDVESDEDSVEDLEVHGKTNNAVAEDKSQDESAEDIEVTRESIIAAAEDVDARHSGVFIKN